MASTTFHTVMTWLCWIAVALVVLAVTVSMALTAYGFFYWLVIPTKEYSYRLHFDYGQSPARTTTTTTMSASNLDGHAVPGSSTTKMVSVGYGDETPPLPLATVNLLSTHREQWNATDLTEHNGTMDSIRLLSTGMGYTVTIRLSLPESPANMYRPSGGAPMVRVDLLDAKDGVLARSSRPVLMKYRSLPVRLARWLLLTPLYVLGVLEEAQTFTLIMFESYVESAKHPCSILRVWLSDPSSQVTSGDVYLIAELKGIAYWMYHWFVTSAVVGTFVVWVGLMLCLVSFWACVAAGGESGDGDGERNGGETRKRKEVEEDEMDYEEEGEGARRGRTRTRIDEHDWRNQEYVPPEDRGFKEE